jgi:hypothetical protein
MQYNFPLEIVGHTYTVYVEPKASVDKERRVGSQYTAQCNISLATITMDGEPLAHSFIEQTFWHETIHAISEHMGCDLTEENVDRLAEGLLQVFKQFGWKAIKEES